MSDDYSPKFGLTPAQYHGAIDKLWKALRIEGVQKDDVFTIAAREIDKGTLIRDAAIELLRDAFVPQGSDGAWTDVSTELLHKLREAVGITVEELRGAS